MLNQRQAEFWRQVVASEDPKFFDGAVLRGLLADLCRHREAIEKISDMINNFDVDWVQQDEGLSRYQTLLQIRDAETRASSALATKLRLTNQARYRPEAAASVARNASRGPKPWEM